MSAVLAPAGPPEPAPGPVWSLGIGQSLPAPGALCPAGWRVLRGALRLDPLRHASPGAAAVQLALPGDLLGLERLCGQPPMFRATALLPCRLQALSVPGDADARAQRLAEALGKYWIRSTEMAALRCGAVPERMARLMAALADSLDDEARSDRIGPAPATPRLPRPRPRGRDLAALLDTTPETVSRILSHWRREALAASDGDDRSLRRVGVYHPAPLPPARPAIVNLLRTP